MNKKLNSYSEVAECIRPANNILVLSHENPDPDAFGSSISLSLALKSQGKKVRVVNSSGQPEGLNFLPGLSVVESIIPGETFDLIIICDCSGLMRLGDDFSSRIQKLNVPVLNIDHHRSNEYFGEYNFVIPEFSSTSEMIFNLIQEFGIEITSDMANLLVAGIYSDTGSLQFACVKPETFRSIATLVEQGADISGMSDKLYSTLPFRIYQLQAYIAQEMELLENNRYAEVTITQEVMQKFNLSGEDLNYVKDFLRKIEGVYISALIRFEDDVWKVSLRSKEPVDSNAIANKLGGGGHKGAAGIKWKGSLEELRGKLREALQNLPEGW